MYVSLQHFPKFLLSIKGGIFINHYFTYQDGTTAAYCRIPKDVLLGETYATLSPEAKLLYGVLLDRAGLSEQNHWEDKDGEIYLYCTIETVQRIFGCGNGKAGKLLHSLTQANLIRRIPQGQGRPARIYVLPWIPDMSKAHTKTLEKKTSSHDNAPSLDLSKPHGNKNYKNKTEYNNIYLPPYGYVDRDFIEEILEENCTDPVLWQSVSPEEKAEAQRLITLMREVIFTTKDCLFIAGEQLPAHLVRQRMLEINAQHLRYVIECMRGQTTQISNIRSYLLTALYHAPTTMDTYYQSLVARDIATLPNFLLPTP